MKCCNCDKQNDLLNAAPELYVACKRIVEAWAGDFNDLAAAVRECQDALNAADGVTSNN